MKKIITLQILTLAIFFSIKGNAQNGVFNSITLDGSIIHPAYSIAEYSNPLGRNGGGTIFKTNLDTRNPLNQGYFYLACPDQSAIYLGSSSSLETLVVKNNKVGIGSTTFPTTAGTIDVSNYKLFVTGGILTEEVRVSLTDTWADYVFKKDYKLPTLKEVEKQIQEKGHLFNVPSAQQVKEDGIELGEMAKIQQEKIEELTLYLIQQNKEIEQLKVLVKTLVDKK